MDWEKLEKGIYNVVLAARTEGIIGGKTKRFARWDTEEILSLIRQHQKIKLPKASIPCPEPIPNDVSYYRGFEYALQQVKELNDIEVE